MLAEKLIAMGFVPEVDFRCQQDSEADGPYIAAWWTDRPQPTAAAIAVFQLPRKFAALSPRQFMTVLEVSGKAEAIYAAVEAIVDPLERATAKAALYYSLEYRREDPLVEMMLPLAELSVDELNTLWDYAASMQFG